MGYYYIVNKVLKCYNYIYLSISFRLEEKEKAYGKKNN